MSEIKNAVYTCMAKCEQLTPLSFKGLKRKMAITNLNWNFTYSICWGFVAGFQLVVHSTHNRSFHCCRPTKIHNKSNK